MGDADLVARVLDTLQRAGFPLVGTCAAKIREPDRSGFERFLKSDLHGPLSYLHSSASLRSEPRTFLPWARGVFCVALPYNASREFSAVHIHKGRAWVSRYAWGRDYHKVLRARLKPAARLLEEAGWKARVCVDSAPVLERALAARAGLGFIGKNGCLIHPRHGSYLFLGEIVTDIDIPDGAPLSDGCADCELCVKGCPTSAFASPRVLDARLCLSTWTIEWRGDLPEKAPALQGHLFGCDRCQEVCPYNRDAPLTSEPEFMPRGGWFAPDATDVAAMSEGAWDAETRGMALRRARYHGLVRNARRMLEEKGPTTETQRHREGSSGLKGNL